MKTINERIQEKINIPSFRKDKKDCFKYIRVLKSDYALLKTLSKENNLFIYQIVNLIIKISKEN